MTELFVLASLWVSLLGGNKISFLLGGSLWPAKNKTRWQQNHLQMQRCASANFSAAHLKRSPLSPSQLDYFDSMIQGRKCVDKYIYTKTNWSKWMCVCWVKHVLCWGFDLLAILQPFDLNVGVKNFTWHHDFLALFHWVARLEPLQESWEFKQKEKLPTSWKYVTVCPLCNPLPLSSWSPPLWLTLTRLLHLFHLF